MKFIVSLKELTAIVKAIKEVVTPEQLDFFKEQIEKEAKESNLFKISSKFDKDVKVAVELYINEEYIMEYANTYAKYMALLVPQAKAIYSTFMSMAEEQQNIVEKFMRKENADGKQPLSNE